MKQNLSHEDIIRLLKIELVRKSDNVNRRFTQRIGSEVIYA